MAENYLAIPPNIIVPLQAVGYDKYFMEQLPYAQGVLAVLSGQTQPDGNIITQDLTNGMQNTGLTLDDLQRFLANLDSNLNAFVTANPGMNPSARKSYTTLYFALFLEYVKLFGGNPKFVPSDDILRMFSGINIQAALDIQKFDKVMYALSAKNPVPGPQSPQICPWVFVYNDRGKAKLFLSKEEMTQYDEKYGVHLLKSIFSKKNLPIVIIGGVSTIAIIVAVAVFLTKRKKKKDAEEKALLDEIEAESKEDVT